MTPREQMNAEINTVVKRWAWAGLVCGIIVLMIPALGLRPWNTTKEEASARIFTVPERLTTYTVKTPVWETTTAVEVFPEHTPLCTLIRYVDEAGDTNEFHAFGVPVVVTTNKPLNIQQ